MIKSHKPFAKKSTEKQFDRISAVRGLLELMKIIGIWQWGMKYVNEKAFPQFQRLQFIQRFCIHVPITFTYIALMWLEVIFASDLDQAGDVLYMSFAEAAAVVKVFNIWINSQKAWKFINELAYDEIFELISPEEIEVWQRKQKQFRNVIIIFLAGSIFTVVSASVSVLLTDDYQLPFAYWVPFEWQTNKRNYWIAYVYNVFGIAVTGLTNASLDMIGCYFLFHTSILYQILGMRLMRLEQVAEKHIIKELRPIIVFHGNIKRISRDCETLISSYFISQIALSAFILCFCAYRMQKMNILENIGQFFSMIQFLFVMVLEIFLPCYFGNQITWNSSQLQGQMYSVNWFKFSIPTRKAIYLYTEFIKHPVKVRAGNYFDVGLPIFSKVLNNAYSFFALIMNAET